MKQRVAERRSAIATERRRLPSEVALLSAEAQRLVDSMSGVAGTARRLVEERLQQVGEQLARCEAQLATAEREIVNLDTLEVEVGWVADCLSDFDGVWDVLTPENRGRLLHAIVERVEVNEPKNQVSVFIADFSTALPGSAETPELVQQQEAAP